VNKKAVIACLLLELVLAYGIDMAGTWHRRDETTAWFAWYKNPTAENSAELQRQKRITLQYDVVFTGALFAAMAAPTLVVLGLMSKKQTTKQV